ncbi:MAG TPA: hypothetical protein DEB09_03340 [Candidatus Magasanikbacteria bacterium]|nr:hypothetical protein [Candidatus Magasanikbacteria bacterium]
MSWFNKIKEKFLNKKEISDPVWEGIIIGKIIKCEKHPNADRLKVCEVDCGNEHRTIVCGGINVQENILVPVAKPGIKVYVGGRELVELKPVVIRGVESAGMICGSDEIGLAEKFPPTQEKEILDLSKYNFAPGLTLANALKLIK